MINLHMILFIIYIITFRKNEMKNIILRVSFIVWNINNSNSRLLEDNHIVT
jgi:hypothetical protein